MARYRAYQARLAGHPIAETFNRATAFLRLAAEASLSHVAGRCRVRAGPGPGGEPPRPATTDLPERLTRNPVRKEDPKR
jgi:hypothetical protein